VSRWNAADIKSTDEPINDQSDPSTVHTSPKIWQTELIVGDIVCIGAMLGAQYALGILSTGIDVGRMKLSFDHDHAYQLWPTPGH
jgi:hypothetical protein